MDMKEKRFNVGDMVTFKNMGECTSVNGTPNKYYYGGGEQGGHRSRIIEYGQYNDETDCWEIWVTSSMGVHYHMLEKEFMEWPHKEKKRFHMDPVKFV